MSGAVVGAGTKLTEVGEIPEEWDVSEIGDSNPFVTSGSRGWAGFYAEFGAPFIRITNMSREVIKLDLEDLKRVKLPQGLSEGKRTQIQEGDVLISITADIGIVSYVDAGVPLPAYINQHIALVRFDQAKVDGRYASYFLAAETSQKWFRGLTDTGAKAGMSLPTIRKIRFACPHPSEQRAIAAALSDMDALISGLDQLIAKKRDLKQAAMQQLLTGQRRLPGFSGAWERKRLADVFSIFAGRSKSAFVAAGGQYWVVDMGSVSINGKLTVSKATNFCGDFLKIGDLIMPKDDIGGGNIIGKVGYIDAENRYVLGDHVYCLRVKQGHPLFLSYVINGHNTNAALRKKVIGSAQLGLGRKSVEEQEIPFPDPSEQSAIATVLSDMDAEIASLESHRAKTRDLKQGMMQELLTGRIRLIDNYQLKIDN